MSTDDYTQHELRECLRGSAGGRATVERHGQAHMEAIGRIGGTAYMQKYGLEHMRDKAAKARAARIEKRYTQPRNVEAVWPEAGIVERMRIVPYRRPGSRRRKPDMVVTEYEAVELAD